MVKRTDVGRVVKILHELGSFGLVGGFAVQLVLLGSAGPAPLPVELIAKWVLAPSLLAVIGSGLLAMGVRPTFFSKGWVWLKVFLTVPPTYATLATHPDIAFMATDRLGPPLWSAIAASVVITFFSVWRPKGMLGLG